MSDLGPDEKLCPYCAETIKRAAIKCRYCQSDLPAESLTEPATDAVPPPPAPADDEVPPPPPPLSEPEETLDGPDEPVDEPVDEPPHGPAKQPLWASARLMVVLLVVCLVLLGVTVFAYHRYSEPAPTVSPVSSTGAREDGLTQAATLTQKVLSYNWQTLDKDVSGAEAVMEPSFRSEYAKTMASVRAQTVQNQVTLTAQTVASSIVSASPTKVVALVFVNQVTKAKSTTNTRIDQNRVLVTLTRHGGEWRVSQMKAF
jgi:Mce-associated membrane protein